MITVGMALVMTKFVLMIMTIMTMKEHRSESEESGDCYFKAQGETSNKSGRAAFLLQPQCSFWVFL